MLVKGPVPQNKNRPTEDEGTPPPVKNVPKPLIISVPSSSAPTPAVIDETAGKRPPGKLPLSGPPGGPLPSGVAQDFPPPPQFPSEEELYPESSSSKLQTGGLPDVEFMRKLDENSQNIDSLYQKVTDLEGKEIELERAMGQIGVGLKRIEKKLGKKYT